jgi:hypothetical protein
LKLGLWVRNEPKKLSETMISIKFPDYSDSYSQKSSINIDKGNQNGKNNYIKYINKIIHCVLFCYEIDEKIN